MYLFSSFFEDSLVNEKPDNTQCTSYTPDREGFGECKHPVLVGKNTGINVDRNKDDYEGTE